MKKITRLSALMVMALMLMVSAGCDKEEKEMTNSLTGTWKVTRYNGADMSTSIIKVFGKDGYYKVTTTILEDDIVYEGTWEWVNNAEVLRVILEDNNEDYRVVSLTSHEFTFKDGAGAMWEMAKQ